MTKLEQKLLELGYTKIPFTMIQYSKEINGNYFYINLEEIDEAFIRIDLSIAKHQTSDNLQQAFNQLQNDLKELKEYEQH